jgi:hypothetical protein
VTNRSLAPAKAASKWPRYRVVVAVLWATICTWTLWYLERFRAPRTFFFDEWAFVFDRRHGGLLTVLEPHNGHLSLVPVAVFRLMFALFGLDHYRPYRVVGLLVHLLVATMVALYVRRRLGEVASVGAGVLVLLLGSGWQNIFWPFQIGYMGSVAGAIAAWLLLDRNDRRGDLGAAAALLLSVMCSGLGIAIVVGTAVRLAAERRWHCGLTTTAPVVAVYAMWYAFFGESQGSAENVPRVLRFVVDSAAFSTAGLWGRDSLWGRVAIGVLMGFALGLVVVRRPLSPSIVAPAVAVVVNWTLTAYSRADEVTPDASRYVYVGAVFLILVVADLLASFAGRTVRWGFAGMALLGVLGNAWILDAGAGGLRVTTAVTRAELRAVEWSQTTVNDYRPDVYRMPQVSASDYLDAVRDLGSPAASDTEVRVSDEVTREEVDRVSLELSGLRASDWVQSSVVSGAAKAPPCTGIGNNEHAGEPLVGESGQVLTLRAADAVIEVRVWRYASGPPQAPTFYVEPGEQVRFALPMDLAPIRQWYISLSSGGKLQRCG